MAVHGVITSSVYGEFNMNERDTERRNRSHGNGRWDYRCWVLVADVVVLVGENGN